MAKYQVDSSDGGSDDGTPEWRDSTSATAEIEVTQHNEGYQTDRRWTVHVRQGHRDSPAAIYALEQQNKGNYWREREPTDWRHAVDFVDLPADIQKRVADTLNRTVSELMPEERIIYREDNSGVGDMAGESTGTCGVCGGRLFTDGDTHEDCVEGDAQ